MQAREHEAALWDRCLSAAKDSAEEEAQNLREANVFRLAGMVLRSSFPDEAAGLTLVSRRYFANHPSDLVPLEQVVRNGWVSNLPRLRAALSFLLLSAGKQ